MKTFVAWIKAFAAAIGGPGLFIIAFLDASFLSLPQISDLLVISMVIQHPYRMPYYVFMATAGSVGGCLALYAIARKGGETALRRFKGGTLNRARRLVEIKKDVLGESGFDDPRELQLTFAVEVTWEDLRNQRILAQQRVPIEPEVAQVVSHGTYAPEVGQSLATGVQQAVDAHDRALHAAGNGFGGPPAV